MSNSIKSYSTSLPFDASPQHLHRPTSCSGDAVGAGVEVAGGLEPGEKPGRQGAVVGFAGNAFEFETRARAVGRFRLLEQMEVGPKGWHRFGRCFHVGEHVVG